jgi:hypothetical protein
MKNLSCLFFICLIFFHVKIFSQTIPEFGDPPNNTNIPDFYKSRLSDIENELANVKKGDVKNIATSPGGLPVYAVYYGKKDNFQSQANYNSAVAAHNPACYAKKSRTTNPVVFFLGPVHGQEAEGIVGLVNLIHIAETGKDHRGKEWPVLKNYFGQCRVIIVPCGNPDGRKRCPYDSFVGLPVEIMTKYGQGTHKDGTSWGWPQAKSLHPMKGDVGILGAYFNNDGINIMHDDFFFPMAEETKTILKIARDEAPDMTVSLHSYELPPSILTVSYLPFFMKERVASLAKRLNDRYRQIGLPHMPEGWEAKATIDDELFPPQEPFNLASALHHISGTMAFTFECSHGTINSKTPKPIVTYDDILDIELNLYQEMFGYLFENRLYWK